MKRKVKDISRRNFVIRSSQATAGIIAASPFLACASQKNKKSKPGSDMKLGLVTYLWGKDWDVKTLISNCTRSNILGVELRTTHAHGVEPYLSKSQRSEIKKRFKDSPVTLVGIGSNENYDSPDQEKLQRSIDATKEFISLSADVGGSGVKVKPNSFHEGVPHDQTIEQIGRSLNILGKYAADYKQEVRLEVHGKCAELPTIKAIMDLVDSPHVGVCWNSNNEDLLGQGLDYNFNLVKNRFGDTAHVRELNIGDYPYQQLMNNFVAMDYKGWILLEARTSPKDPIKAMQEQYAVFNDMIVKAQGI